MRPLKEWKDLNGELGVYHSHAHDSYDLFILIPSAEKHTLQPYPPTDRDKAIHLTECIAAFAVLFTRVHAWVKAYSYLYS